MDDLIKRQEVLNAIDQYILGKPLDREVEVRALIKLITKIYNMPSAEQSGGLYVDGYHDGYKDGWKEGREALRQEAIKAVDDLPNCYNGFSDTYDKAYIIGVLEELPSAQPEIPPYVAEIEAEYKKWVNIPYIRKPLAKALYEVWKKHDREDAERRTYG